MTGTSVSYLGSIGSYSFQVARELFPDATLISRPSFAEVVNAVESGEATYAIIPVENSISGRIPDVHRILLNIELFIRGEHILKIQHCLVGAPADVTQGASGQIHTIFSHDQGFVQCQRYLKRNFPDVKLVRTEDTATAVRHVAEAGDPHAAAIGSMVAAMTYGAPVIAENIADQDSNYTRFFVLERPGGDPGATTPDITTLIFQVDHRPGALLDALTCFAREAINITKLETYPISDAMALPAFYIDIGAGLRDARLERALSALESTARHIKLLGTYPASDKRSFSSGFLPTKFGSAG